MGGSALHGVTIFSDMSNEEFRATYLGYEPIDTPEVIALSSLPIIPDKYDGDEKRIDWTGVYTTDTKNQGYCGSCW